MTAAFIGTDLATASQYLKDATEATVRDRLLPRFLDEEGRINRNATGKDLNWLIEYKLPVAVPYTGQQLNFANDNFNIPASVTPEWFVATQGMNFRDVKMNSGDPRVMDNYTRKGYLMMQAMQVKFAKDLYADALINVKSLIGIGTLTRRSTTLVCTHADRIAVPLAGVTYAGLSLAPQSYGGAWSNALTGLNSQMSTVLGSDWPDGQGSPDQAYDATTPRLYNENTNRWTDQVSAAADSSWAVNCIPMLSRANTDLGQNSVKTMMPNVHTSGAGRHQAVKDSLRVSFRDTMYNNVAAENLGYHEALNYENAAIVTDHECPPDRTYSVCAASMDIFFYGNTGEGGKSAAAERTGAMIESDGVTGGIFTVYGPERIPGTLDWAWIMVAGGNARYSPKWVACHKDFTTGV